MCKTALKRIQNGAKDVDPPSGCRSLSSLIELGLSEPRRRRRSCCGEAGAWLRGGSGLLCLRFAGWAGLSPFNKGRVNMVWQHNVWGVGTCCPMGGLGEQGREGEPPWYTDFPACLWVSGRRDSAEPPAEFFAAFKRGFGDLVSPLGVPLSTSLLVFTPQMHSHHGMKTPEGPSATQAPSGTGTRARLAGLGDPPRCLLRS